MTTHPYITLQRANGKIVKLYTLNDVIGFRLNRGDRVLQVDESLVMENVIQGKDSLEGVA
jgi:hypothetical protein